MQASLTGHGLDSQPVLCPHPYQRKSCTVYVAAGSVVQGLCGVCIDAMKRLIRRQADQETVRRVLGDLGYEHEEADQFYRDMQGMSPEDVQLWEDVA